MRRNPLEAWKGAFGDGYRERNPPSAEDLKWRLHLWQPIFRSLGTRPPQSILEVGANIGNNLRAIRMFSSARLLALEPNEVSRKSLLDSGLVQASDALDGDAATIALPDGAVDFAFTCGVLIHVDPADHSRCCREIFRVSRSYVMCAEYFSTDPVEVVYRGEHGLLFKRDFGGLFLDTCPELELIDHGFLWQRATNAGDLTWWLFRKRS
jgi:pseudaminic acid biosynthesis-associated methylase